MRSYLVRDRYEESSSCPPPTPQPQIAGTWEGQAFTIKAPPLAGESGRVRIRLELTKDASGFSGDLFSCSPPPCGFPASPQAPVELFFIKQDAFVIQIEDSGATVVLHEPCVTLVIDPVPALITGTGSLNQAQTTMTFLVSNRNNDCVPEISTVTLDRQP